MKSSVSELIDEIRKDANCIGCELIIKPPPMPSGQTLLVIIPNHPICIESLNFGMFDGMAVSISSRLTQAHAKHSTYYKKLSELYVQFKMAKPELSSLARSLQNVGSQDNVAARREYKAIIDAWNSESCSITKH